MKMAFRAASLASLLVVICSSNAQAWNLEGHVYCKDTGVPLAGVVVNVQGNDVAFTGSGTTDDTGLYVVWLLDVPGTYTATPDPNTFDGGSSTPPSFTFTTTDAVDITTGDFVVTSPACGILGCWLTGGGAKFSAITGGTVAEKGPQVNFGGNVYPSCNPDPGQGGQWNHVDHSAKLFFQGIAITVDRCGNVSGIPPGSTSPVTPYNFIEFHGTGRLKGIAGNKYLFENACFVARAEDRNEPGSSGAKAGALIDRYFIRVTNCAGTTLLVLEATPGQSDPVLITDGNLQLHASSCSQ